MRTPLAHRALSHDGRTRAERLRETRARQHRTRKSFGSALLAVVMSIPLVLAVSGGATADAAPVSVFSRGGAPNTVSSDVNAVELGMKFRSSVAGTVTAIDYFKATGAPVATKSGHLWSSTGQLLASVTFSNETASGWQEATLSLPVTIAAASTYVVSYYAPKGGYTSTHNYFTTDIVNGPLTVPASGERCVLLCGYCLLPEPDLHGVELLRRPRVRTGYGSGRYDDHGADHPCAGNRAHDNGGADDDDVGHDDYDHGDHDDYGHVDEHHHGARDDDHDGATVRWPVVELCSVPASVWVPGRDEHRCTGRSHVDEGSGAGDVGSGLVVLGDELFRWCDVHRECGFGHDGVGASRTGSPHGAVDHERDHDQQPEDPGRARQLLGRGDTCRGVSQCCDHQLRDSGCGTLGRVLDLAQGDGGRVGDQCVTGCGGEYHG